MQKAIAACREGVSVKQVSRRYDIPRTEESGKDADKDASMLMHVGRFRPVFDSHMENELSKHPTEMQQHFYGLMLSDLRKLAFEYAETRKIDHPFDCESKMAREDWLGGFLKRTRKLSIRKPEPTSLGRAVGFNKPQVDGFYNNLQVLIEQHNLTAHQVWNVDESGLTTVHTPRNIIAKKGAKQVGMMTSGEKGKTILCCMSAGGTFVPPMLIFPKKNMAESDEWGTIWCCWMCQPKWLDRWWNIC